MSSSETTSNAMNGYSIETKAVHAGRSFDSSNGAIVPSICLSTTFKQIEPCVLMSVCSSNLSCAMIIVFYILFRDLNTADLGIPIANHLKML